MPDEDDRPRDARRSEPGGAGTPWPSGGRPLSDLVVPDDISALAADIEDYHRELRAERRRARRNRLLARRGVLPTVIVSGALLLAGIVATLLTVMSPQLRAPMLSQAPVARPTVAPGLIGGDLPDAELAQADGGTASAVSLRPALLALIPTHCGCTPLLDNLAGQAYADSYPLDIVAPTAPDGDTQAAALLGQLHRGSIGVFYDSQARLATDLSAQGVTVVLLDRDGTIFNIIRDVGPDDTTLSADLQRMRSETRISG